MTPYARTLQAEFVQCMFRRGLLHRLLGNLEHARNDFFDLTVDRNPQASFWLAKILVEQGKLREACDFLEGDPDNMIAESRALLAAILMQRTPSDERDFPTALMHLKKACEKNASKSMHMTKLVCQAADALRHNEPRRALALLDKVAAPRKRLSQPYSARERAEAHVEQARQVSQKRDLAAKGNDLEIALDCTTYLDLVRNGETLVHELRTCAYIKLSMWEDAVQSARHVDACSSTASPDSSEFNKNMALGMLKEDAALSHFTKSVLLFPKSCARLHRAVCLCHMAYHSRDSKKRSKFVKDALEEMQWVLNTESSSQDVLAAQCIRTIGAYCLRDFAVAWSAYQAVKAAHPNFCEFDILGAEICALQGWKEECEKLCAKQIETRSNAPRLVCPYATRAKCLLKERLRDGIEDLKIAVRLACDPTNVQLLLGDASFVGGRYREACAAYEACYRHQVTARVTYSLTLIYLKMGKVKAALTSAFETAQLHPVSDVVQATKNGLLCLQDMLLGSFQNAHIRWTSMLVKNQEVSTDDLYSSVFSVYEVLLYRGVCSLYMDCPQKALQDFEIAIESLHLLYDTASNYKETTKPERLAPEVCLRDAMVNFEANVRYNMAVCYLFLDDFVKAADIFTGLLPLFDEKPVVLRACLWFFLGLCQLAQQQMESRESFMRSYALDNRWVDDFLTTHVQEPLEKKNLFKSVRSQTPRYDARPPSRLSSGLSRPSTRACTGNATARGHYGPQPLVLSTGRNHLGSRLEGKKARLRDIVLSIRPACDWPFVSPPNLDPKVDWAMLTLSSHGGVQTEPAYPWE